MDQRQQRGRDLVDGAKMAIAELKEVLQPKMKHPHATSHAMTPLVTGGEGSGGHAGRTT